MMKKEIALFVLGAFVLISNNNLYAQDAKATLRQHINAKNSAKADLKAHGKKYEKSYKAEQKARKSGYTLTASVHSKKAFRHQDDMRETLDKVITHQEKIVETRKELANKAGNSLSRRWHNFRAGRAQKSLDNMNSAASEYDKIAAHPEIQEERRELGIPSRRNQR
jgi:cell wall-associated NlpC family hydrolase